MGWGPSRMIHGAAQRFAARCVAIGLVLFLGGCSQPASPTAITPVESSPPPTPTPTPPTIQLVPIQLPSGYMAVGAVGDTLILRNLGQKDTDSLVPCVNGQLGEEIVRQPSNTMSAFASDDRWFVWCEAKGEMQKKLTDPWKIWAWDSETGKVKQIAQEAALIDGVASLGELGPRLRIADGRVVWTAWTKDAAPRVQLHLHDLKTDQHRILATAELSAPIGGYDIHGALIAYGQGKQVVLVSDAGTETIASDEEVGEVLVTADGVVWQGRRLMFWHDAQGTRVLASGAANRWWYTSTDHYITWWEAPGDQLRLLHTPSGTEHVVIEPGVNNGGFVFGRYVAWTERVEGNTAIGMVAKLP